MKRQFLGDSYDAVKRLWHEAFSDWAPLPAEPRFIPEGIRQECKALHAFPDVSRAPFLFACSDRAHMIGARGLLLRMGVPANRIAVPE